MKQQTQKAEKRQLTLNKKAIANLTLSAAQMAHILGGAGLARGETDPKPGLSFVGIDGGPCTARPTNIGPTI